jgi:indolepyruvate ferredoxin oxidoreductase
MMAAIELNNVAIGMNKKAFMLGRLAAADMSASGTLGQAKVVQFTAPKPLEEMVAFRADWLKKYQDERYAQRYVEAVRKIERKEMELDGANSKKPLTKAVARSLFKLMAYKDEYEVARLHTTSAFRKQIEAQFQGDYTLEFHLAPPLLARKKPGSDVPAKIAFGGWMMQAFRALAPLKVLRGTPFDVFGYTAERRRERTLRDDYFRFVDEASEKLSADNKGVMLKLAQLPEKVRGYGHVKLAAMEKAENEARVLREQMEQGTRGVAVVQLHRVLGSS